VDSEKDLEISQNRDCRLVKTSQPFGEKSTQRCSQKSSAFSNQKIEAADVARATEFFEHSAAYWPRSTQLAGETLLLAIRAFAEDTKGVDDDVFWKTVLFCRKEDEFMPSIARFLRVAKEIKARKERPQPHSDDVPDHVLRAFNESYNRRMEDYGYPELKIVDVQA